MLGAFREWLFALTLLVSLLLHAAILLFAWLFGSDFQPPAAITPRQGKVSIQRRASVDAQTLPVDPARKPLPTPVLPELTPQLELDPPAPLPIVPEPQRGDFNPLVDSFLYRCDCQRQYI